MLAASIRSGLEETLHDGAVAVVDSDGALIASFGAVERPFYLRSAAKPFQAKVAQDHGADLAPVELAVACSSHDGDPVHVGLVESILGNAGLTSEDLGCPPDWPLGPAARERMLRKGLLVPNRLWHNCSGKHAAWLRACADQGWDKQSYLDPDHPLQQKIITFVSELGDHRVEPVGVDGCGAPVLRTTAVAMARLYSRLGSDDSLADVFEAIRQYPRLVSGVGNADAEIAVALGAAAKRGASGCIGIAMGDGLGVAVRSWDGLGRPADVGAIATLEALGRLTPTATSHLMPYSRPTVEGGGAAVGHIEPRVDLQFP